MRLTPALALGVALLATTAQAQVVPSLGADKVVGSAGVETVSIAGSLGMPINPALIGADHRWSVGLGSSSGSVTGILEQTATASARIGSIGLAARVSSRQLRNVFEDPALNNDPDLRVESDEYALGMSVALGNAIRLGALGFATNSHMISSSANGLGYRLGADVSLAWARFGVAFGDDRPPMSWQSFDGGVVLTDATKRLSIGAGTPIIHVAGFEPGAALEWNRDSGHDNDTWVRGSISVGVLHGALRALAGRAECSGQPLAGYSELGLIAAMDRFQFQFGYRFGASPAPGNAMTIGLGIHAK